MSFKARLTRLERRLKECLPQQKVVVMEVDSFEPGPSAALKGPVRIVVRDRQGNERLVDSLRQFYDITVQDRRSSPTPLW